MDLEEIENTQRELLKLEELSWFSEKMMGATIQEKFGK